MSLAPVALNPAGDCPINNVTGMSAAAESLKENCCSMSGMPVMGVALRSKSSSESIKVMRATERDMSRICARLMITSSWFVAISSAKSFTLRIACAKSCMRIPALDHVWWKFDRTRLQRTRTESPQPGRMLFCACLRETLIPPKQTRRDSWISVSMRDVLNAVVTSG